MLAGVTEGKATAAATNSATTHRPTSATSTTSSASARRTRVRREDPVHRPVRQGDGEPGQREQAQRDAEPRQQGDELGRDRVGAPLDDLLGLHVRPGGAASAVDTLGSRRRSCHARRQPPTAPGWTPPGIHRAALRQLLAGDAPLRFHGDAEHPQSTAGVPRPGLEIRRDAHVVLPLAPVAQAVGAVRDAELAGQALHRPRPKRQRRQPALLHPDEPCGRSRVAGDGLSGGRTQPGGEPLGAANCCEGQRRLTGPLGARASRGA